MIKHCVFGLSRHFQRNRSPCSSDVGEKQMGCREDWSRGSAADMGESVEHQIHESKTKVYICDLDLDVDMDGYGYGC
jgi:hypothetical protein